MGKSKNMRVILVLLVCMLMISACSSQNNQDAGNNSEDAAPAQSETAEAAASGDGEATDASNESNESTDPFGKYEQPVTLSTFRCVNDAMAFPGDDNIDNNTFSRLYESELGIKLTNQWVVSNTQCEEKTNLSIVSGELPDFFPVNAKQLKTLVDAGMLEDMTSYVEQYGSPFLKDIYAANNGLMLTPATYNGKLMAIPGTSRGLNGVDLLWIREDWKQKLNLPDPKTMDDVLTIIKAFVEQDPDGNGKNDTFGLNLSNDFYGGYSGLQGFFASYHAYPFSSASTSMWIKDAEGKLVYGGIQPEMKPALLALQKLYKEGAIDKQFVVYDAAKSAENEKQGKTGLHFGYSWNIGWPIDVNDKKNDPNMEWKPYPIASIDGTPASVGVTDPSSYWYFAVKKGVEHPEAVVKMLNLFLEKVYGENAEPEKYHTFLEGDVGYPVFQYSPVQVEHPEKNQTAWKKVNEALQTGDVTNLNPEQKSYYDAYMKYQDGDVMFWGADRTWGPEGSFAVLGYYKDNKLQKINEFLGAPTATMAQKGSILMDMEKEMITKVILGEPIELFDRFVEDWKKSGGDQITEEVNEWYNSK